MRQQITSAIHFVNPPKVVYGPIYLAVADTIRVVNSVLRQYEGIVADEMLRVRVKANIENRLTEDMHPALEVANGVCNKVIVLLDKGSPQTSHMFANPGVELNVCVDLTLFHCHRLDVYVGSPRYVAICERDAQDHFVEQPKPTR